MGLKKAYKGYKAYDYLTPGEDYMEFALTPKDRIPEWLVPLTAEQEKRVDDLLMESEAEVVFAQRCLRDRKSVV